jgi:MFS family permease
VLLFSGFSIIGLGTFNSFAQPYLLQEVLHIPKGQQGSLIGMLGLIQEAIVILLVGVIGASSDKLGRRAIYVGGVFLFGLGFIIYPLAETLTQLYAVRVFYAFGFAGASVMLHVCLAEYPQEISRGKWIGTAAVCNGFGVVLMAFVLSRMPAWFESLGYDSVQAIRMSFRAIAACFLMLAVLIRVGMAPGKVKINRHGRNLKVLAQGIVAARSNPRIVLSYCMAFASRGDLVILTTFFSLWLVQRGDELGWGVAETIAKAGMLFGVSQLCGLLWSYPMGMIIDRFNRMTAMCIAFGIATVGYFALGQISDPFGSNLILIACVLAGMGEASVMIAGAVLVGQEAPAASRGAVLGTFSLFGALGIMVLTYAGGVMFDKIGPTAPFMMMGWVNLVVAIGAIALRLRSLATPTK